MLSLRLTSAEKAAFQAAAERNGDRSLTAWAMDRLRVGGGPDLRLRQAICGLLGRHGARLAALDRTVESMGMPAARAEIRALAAEVVAIQRWVIAAGKVGGKVGGEDARESDPGAP